MLFQVFLHYFLQDSSKNHFNIEEWVMKVPNEVLSKCSFVNC